MAVAVLALPALPVVATPDEQAHGWDRIDAVWAVLVPALFPALALAQRRIANPWARRGLLLVELGAVAVAMLVCAFEMDFSFLPLVHLPGFWAVLGAQAAAGVLGVVLGWSAAK